jgi:TolB protein
MEPTARPSRRSSSRRFEQAAGLGVLVLGAVWAALPRVAAQGQVAPPQGDAPAQIIITGTPPRLAVPECVPRRGDEASRAACRTITQVLRNDLAFEGLFQFVAESNMAAIPPLNPESPNFADWRSIGAGILVITRAEATGSDMSVEVRVHSVDSGQLMMSRRYSGKVESPRVFAHQASDDILALTQYKGVARTKIAFNSDRDADSRHRAKEIYMVDYDGYNPRRMTVNLSLNIMPAWSPDGRNLAYVSYRGGSPDIYLASIFAGRSSNLTNGRGQSFAPSFSPDGKRIAYSSSVSGNSEIWVANADGTSPRKLTTSPASDTAPAWSPTGQEIVFTSSRTGNPQLYVMNDEGLNVRRISNVGNYNDAPAWNPSKEYVEVAYTSRLESGGFDIAVVDLASGQVRQVTQGRGSCEYPSWAPNGRHLVFACNRGGTWQLTVSDRDGRNVQTLSTGSGNNVYPDWSPAPPTTSGGR